VEALASLLGLFVLKEEITRMRRMYRKIGKKAKRYQKRHLSFLEALRLYAGMPVEI
jgi:hypothetical protein